MTATFKQFLQEQASKHRAEAAAGKAEVDEWRAAIERLFGEIRRWIKDSDPDNIVEIKEEEVEVKEPGLGPYRVPRLDLRVFGKWIGVVPRARRTVGTATSPENPVPQRAQGRVDISDELRRYVLYRMHGDVWVIVAPEQGFEIVEKSWPGQVQYFPRSETVPLSQETFEKVLVSYLR